MKGRDNMTCGLWVIVEAKPGKEAEVEQFLLAGLPVVEHEPGIITWYAVKLGATTFGIFDTFPDDSERHAHLSGKVAAALKENAPDLFLKPPVIQQFDILASKHSG